MTARARPLQWREILTDALARHEAVSVRSVVANHLRPRSTHHWMPCDGFDAISHAQSDQQLASVGGSQCRLQDSPSGSIQSGGY